MSFCIPWVPNLGRLVYRWLIGPSINEITLYYRDEPDREDRYQVIAEMKNFRVLSNNKVVMESREAKMNDCGSGNFIIREYADSGILIVFIRLWDHDSQSLDDWINKLGGNLLEDEKERLCLLVENEKRRWRLLSL